MLWVCPGKETKDLERKRRYAKTYTTYFLQYFVSEIICNQKVQANESLALVLKV